jgi:hypothetical protein
MVRLAAEYNLKVYASFETALDGLDALHREPTHTEQDLFVHALAYMLCGNYRLARAELRTFMSVLRPPEGLDAPPGTGRKPFTTAMLRRGHLRMGAFV